MSLDFCNEKGAVGNFTARDVTWKNCSFLDMFQKKLVTEYNEVKQVGGHEFTVRFERPRRLSINAKIYLVKGANFRVLRECRKKIKWVPFSGEAYFDWNKSKIMVPSQSTIYSGSFRADLSDWDDYDGKIPPATGFLDCRLTAFIEHFDPNKNLPDLDEM